MELMEGGGYLGSFCLVGPSDSHSHDMESALLGQED